MKKLLLIALILLAGCKKMFLGEELSGNAVDVFETLWEDFDKHYALFELKGIDWDAQYAYYRPLVTPETTEDELWSLLCQMIEPFADSHVSIWSTKYPYYFYTTNESALYRWDFTPETVDDFLSNPARSLNPYLKWGEVAERNIGYIHVSSFDENDYPIGDIDKLVACVANFRAIIVDVRNNRGGVAAHVWRLSSWFSDNTDLVHYTQTRNGPSHTDFAKPIEHRNFMLDDNLSNKPVILLTNSATVSAGEWLTSSMKTFANVTHIGTTTSGAYSARSVSRFLPNGWQYCYSIQKVTLPDGSSPEGIGCIPDILIENDPEKWYEDNVMEEALDYLARTYGI